MFRASNQRSEPRGNQRLEATPVELAGLPILPEEWQAIVTLGPNLLVEGPECSTERVVRAVSATCQGPVWEWDAAKPHQEPAATLIVRRIDLLGVEELRRLLDYLNAEGTQTRVQVISTSTRLVYALVESGMFDAGLYYRLNTIRLELDQPA